MCLCVCVCVCIYIYIYTLAYDHDSDDAYLPALSPACFFCRYRISAPLYVWDFVGSRVGRNAAKNRKTLNIAVTTEPPIKCAHNDAS